MSASNQRELFSKAILNVKQYTKNLKQKANVSPTDLQSLNSTDKLSFDAGGYSQTSSGYKTKHKIQSMALYNDSIEGSTYKIKDKQTSSDKYQMIMGAKYMEFKKDAQSESQMNREVHPFSKSYSKIDTSNISNSVNTSLNNRDMLLPNKKSSHNGHSHTYTHLNDMDSDQFSQVDYNLNSRKETNKINKYRHSKSPNKQRHIQHNNTSYGQQNYKVSNMNKIHIIQSQAHAAERKQDKLKIDQLLLKITNLQTTIHQYKHVIMQMRNKYLQMEWKVTDKVMNEHLVDVLKVEIGDMQVMVWFIQGRNGKMKEIIEMQQKTIQRYQRTFVGKIRSIHERYVTDIEESIILKRQNQMLKRILMIAQSNISTSLNDRIQVEPLSNPQKQNHNIFIRNIARSIDQMKQKWSV